ncbi:hypothetical protein GUJ93_ZPchr0011g28564 [Zizania palustris]|uniref:Uncharacterized protein n=1 Tax=Zizania palustris TaxID=103762 RepID=A0A8J5WGD6_ZIZPA|nr:hypothetical protein GUJ93_ZPchr0011g28564 [Zizania palustris]
MAGSRSAGASHAVTSPPSLPPPPPVSKQQAIKPTPATTMAMPVIRLVRPAISPAAAAAAAASSSPSSVRPRGRVVRTRVRCRAGGSEGGLGEEEDAPESLFAKELRRRGMAPGSAVPGVKKAGTVEAEEGGRGGEAGRKRVAAAAEFERAASGAEGQRERSMALNSEGLEGLVPRAKLLLSLGTTFFLGFGPLIMVTVSLFAGLYVYFGPRFVHDASKTPASPPPYIDPYELLEDDRLTRPSPDVF